MHDHLSTNRSRYFYLMSLVCEDLPTKAVDALLRDDHPANYEELRAVRQSRKINLPWLIDLVRKGLPDFQIPADAMPIPEVRPRSPRPCWTYKTYPFTLSHLTPVLHLNTDPVAPPRKPSILDYAELIAPTGLLPETLVKLAPMPELERRCEEINRSHPQYREETPVLLAAEQARRQYLSQGLHVSASRIRVA